MAYGTKARFLVAAAAVAALGLTAYGLAYSPDKVLVYCPVGIDTAGCDNVVNALSGPNGPFPGGVDRAYDGTSGTVDLATANLSQYAVFVVPSLADGPESKPYEVLRNRKVAYNLSTALRGRLAVWSGTPDQGTASRTEKDRLIRNLAVWARGDTSAAERGGIVVLQDHSDDPSARYAWLEGFAGMKVGADAASEVYDAVQALTATGTEILDNGGQQLAYASMASFGLQPPAAATGAAVDARGGASGGQIVLVTSPKRRATIKTDRADYSPGDTVVFTGSGWQPGETVNILLREDPKQHEDTTLTAVADADGNIINREYTPEEHDVGATYYVTATGQSSALAAQTTFTDGPTVDLEAWKTLTTPPGWSESTLNSGDHDYNEDESIPFRLVLKRLDPGTPWTITIEYDFADGSRRFFDWLSTYNRSVALTNAEACSGRTCSSGPTTFPIPADPLLPPGVQEAGVFTVFNGSITTTGTYVTVPSGGSASKKQLLISGTTAAGGGKKDVIILFGGHLAQELDWGTGNGASSFPGASAKMYFSAYSGGGPDGNLAVNPRGIAKQADLSITKTDSPDPVDPGSNLTYTLTVTNNGPNQATAANVEDPLPSGTTLVSATPSQGTCTGTTTVSCSLGAINAGASATITIVVEVATTASGTLSNTATVSGSPTDPNSGNNSATATTTVAALPAISIDDVTKAEGNSGTTPFTFTVSLSKASAKTVTVNYATTDGSATTADADYVTAAGTVTFAPGVTSQQVTVNVNGDTKFESDETFTVNLSAPTNATIADGQGVGTIVNDDGAPSLSINDVSVTEGNAPATVTATFTVTLSAASGQTTTVNYTTSDGSATAPADYVAASGTLTFLPGETTKQIDVTVNGDALDEPDETFFVNLSGATNAAIGDGQGQGTILDDDAAPTISINDVTVTEGNAGTTPAIFTVALSGASGQTVTVNYATADGTATAGGDYVAATGTVTFLPGETSKDITVQVNGDATDEPNETFFVNLSGAVNATISDAQGQGTIVDDDEAPTLSINDVTVTEGNAGTVNAVFTVTLSAASGKTVTVDFNTADGSATTADADYLAAAGTLTFLPGATSQQVTVQVNGDTKFEPDEDFSVNLSNPVNATIADGQGTGTILNDDAQPAISINDVTNAEGNVGTTPFTFTVSLSNTSSQTVTVNYATADGTATVADGDYVATSGVLTFAPGQVQQTVTVLVNGDTKFESDETFTVNLSAPTNATIADGVGQGTITNDDTQPTIAINDVSANEGNAGPTPFTFTVSLSNPSSQTVTVNYATADGTAMVADADYVAATGTVTFAPGATSEQVTVTVTGDTKFEPDETFTVNLTAPTNATIADGQGVGTILNDDTQPTISINDVTKAEGNVGLTSFEFTVSLSNASSQVVTVNYATQNGSATTADGDYIAANGVLTFTPGQTEQTITVSVNGDMKFEPDETFSVELSMPANATIADGVGQGTITNDDTQPTISINDASAGEGDVGPTPFTFTVTLSNASFQTVTVNYATADGTATVADADYMPTSGTVTFLPGVTSQQVVVNVNGDTKFEANETFFVNLSNPTNATITDGQGQGTIVNDDPQPTIAIGDVTKAEGNSGTTAFDFAVTLSNASSETITVTYATQDGTATVADLDYQAAAGVVTFAPGTTTQTITVQVNGDTKFEPDETFTVNLNAPTNATIAEAEGVGVGTITNDDTQPTISIDDVARAEGDLGTTAFDFTVTLSNPSFQTVTVQFATADGTAMVADADYVAATGTVTFLPGQTGQTVTVQVNGDTKFEPDETFFVNLSAPSNATIADGQGQGTILNDDPQPTISINDVTANEGNAGLTSFTFTVSLSNPSSQTVTVSYATADGSATVADGDYVAASGAVTFAPGETSQPVTVQVSGDTKFEPTEDFFVNLSNPVNATIADGQGKGTILNDDAQPTISINDVSANEGDAATTPFTFTVSLSNPSSQTVTVNYATADGTATVADGDYVANSGVLTFAPGQVQQTVTVLVNGDTKDEQNEDFFVNLTNAVNATIADGQGAGTILDDDAAPTLSINDVTVTEGNTGTTPATFTVTLSAQSGKTVTVTYATADGTAMAGSDYVPAAGELIFAPGETSKQITVLVNGDLLDEPNETFFVDLTIPVNATISDGQGQGTIVDDDEALPGKVTGGGQIAVMHNGSTGRANFGFNVQRKAIGLTPTGHLEYLDHLSRLNVRSLTMTTLLITGTHADFSGTCTIIGASACTFQVSVDDLGEPGKGKDKFYIKVEYTNASGPQVYSQGGVIERGNIQIHKEP
jgi:hypothetical protein